MPQRQPQRFCCDDCRKLYGSLFFKGSAELVALLGRLDMNNISSGPRSPARSAVARSLEDDCGRLPDLIGSAAEVSRSKPIRHAALSCGAKLLSQVEASRANAEKSGQLAGYGHVHETMSKYLLQLKAECRAAWWLTHYADHADDRCWKQTLRERLATRNEFQCV